MEAKWQARKQSRCRKARRQVASGPAEGQPAGSGEVERRWRWWTPDVQSGWFFFAGAAPPQPRSVVRIKPCVSLQGLLCNAVLSLNSSRLFE
jgi:hypothetical protein